MKKSIVLLILFSLVFTNMYAQDITAFGLLNKEKFLSDNNDNEEIETTSDKIKGSLGLFIIGSIAMGMSIGMREGVYKNNYGNNWWGTVNGVFSLAFACELIGMGIPYMIYKITDGRFSENYVIWGGILGVAAGVTMAFSPPFKQAFRENGFLYYSFPGLFTAVCTFVIFDIWFGKKPDTTGPRFLIH